MSDDLSSASDELSSEASLFEDSLTGESAGEFASDVVDNADEVVDDATDEIGLTSDESGDDNADSETKKSWLSDFNVYDGMLLMALVFIALATFVLFRELNTFGNILSGDFPWRVS